MKSLDSILLRATREHWAVPHFNFATLEQLKAIVGACRDLASPVIVGLSEGERDFVGLRHGAALVQSFGEEGATVFLNADHTKSIERAKEAIDAGYTSVHIDLSLETLEKNIEGAKTIVEYARAKNRNISVEGELGIIRGESQVRDEIIQVSPRDYTSVEDAKRFVGETGVSRLAVMVGNIHGLWRGEPKLDIERIREIRRALPEETALVLHAGSGIDDAQIRAAIEAGIANVHISTELRRIWRDSTAEALGEMRDEYASYRILELAVTRTHDLVIEKIRVFGSAGKLNFP